MFKNKINHIYHAAKAACLLKDLNRDTCAFHPDTRHLMLAMLRDVHLAASVR